MRQITIRQFQQKFYTEIKDLPVKVTRNDEPVFVVVPAEDWKNIADYLKDKETEPEIYGSGGAGGIDTLNLDAIENRQAAVAIIEEPHVTQPTYPALEQNPMYRSPLVDWERQSMLTRLFKKILHRG